MMMAQMRKNEQLAQRAIKDELKQPAPVPTLNEILT